MYRSHNTRGLTREQAAHVHADLARHPFGILTRYERNADVAHTIRQLLHLAEVDRHVNGDRPDLIMAEGWLLYATGDGDIEGTSPSSRAGQDQDASAARAVLRRFHGRDLPEDTDQQREILTRLMVSLIRVGLIDRMVSDASDAADLLAAALRGIRRQVTSASA
ncbi:hypothetical protein [Streptomyces sp. MP131-18]|uniref:hypothetical protein n=1 Tax=Streptomyces sp. MP131-18 TaxID=1857892 RepID=UPI00097C2380|nr:hypothetical protein [Streptomyces sp. MP131-18]ONK13257.1 hypothetical protein STBA_40200 [Streptomyces sp. MP131-18]